MPDMRLAERQEPTGSFSALPCAFRPFLPRTSVPVARFRRPEPAQRRARAAFSASLVRTIFFTSAFGSRSSIEKRIVPFPDR